MPDHCLSQILRLERVSRKFGPIYALRGLSLTVCRGEFIALFGPNGAGKTTLLQMIARMLPPTAGKVEFCEDPKGLSVGYVSHRSLLYGDLTGLENLLFYGRLYDLPDPSTAARHMLCKLGLEKAQDQIVRTYSSGMRQRLALARALLHDPELLLLDEPYSGLDRHGSRLLLELLKDLKKEGKTVLLITHNLAEGLEISSRVLILREGVLALDRPRKEISAPDFERTYFQSVDG
jgi:heme exporter protein A